MPHFTEDSLRRIIINPSQAVNIDPLFATEHPPLIWREKWIDVNVMQLRDLGAEGWLRQLLNVLGGNIVTAEDVGFTQPGGPFGYGAPGRSNQQRQGKKSDQEEETMKSLAFLKHVAHDRKAAIYAAAHDGKLRNFAYHEELGECRETFARLVQEVQQGEIGLILTPDAACLAIETSPGWMEAFIQAVKQHEVLIGDHSHDLVYDLHKEEDEALFRGLSPEGEYEKARSAPRSLVDAIAQSHFAAAYIEQGENWFLVTRFEGKDPDAPIYSLSSGAIGQDVDMLMLGHWKELLDVLARYGMSKEGGWCPDHPERKDWLSRTQQQEDSMAAQTATAMKPHRASLSKGAQVRVIVPGSGKVRGNKSRRRGGKDTGGSRLT